MRRSLGLNSWPKFRLNLGRMLSSMIQETLEPRIQGMAYQRSTLATCLPPGENRTSSPDLPQVASTPQCKLAVISILMRRFMHKYQAYEFLYILESVKPYLCRLTLHFCYHRLDHYLLPALSALRN